MLPEIDQTVFDQSLLLTQAYCELQLKKPFENNIKVLRSINPLVNNEPIFSLEKRLYSNTSFGGRIWKEDPLSGSELLYHDLFKRQLEIKGDCIDPVGLKEEHNGKVLVAEIGTVIRDGISAHETEFFIDENDCPPIDTWFYLTRGKYGLVLFAWIPTRFINVVQDGIDVNMLDIFNWFDNGAFFDNRYSFSTY